MVSYFKELAKLSDRVHFQVIGYTNEKRPQIVATITSPENFANIDQIRQSHLQNADPASAEQSQGPAIVLLGYNVHGNEPSSAEAAILTAYWLTASTNQEVSHFLENTVVFIDPSFNPDGRDRHTTWVNSHHGFPPVSIPLDREHNEAWPGGRGNHYSFDLNRDWLPISQVESQNRMKFYHQWLPNVVTDFHEMGTNSTYFFEPTEPFGSENPVVPRDNYDGLNNLFAKYYEEAMNEIGSLYFTKEVYDNSYPGYGSTYPDIHGGLGMVFEQASSRGHVQQSSTGEVEFRFTIKNHLRNSMATVKASSENKELLLKHQRDFFISAIQEGRKSAVKGYVFGADYNRVKTNKFLQLLLDHDIDVFELEKPLSEDGSTYVPGNAYTVPTEQKQYRMVRTMFEKVTQFYDSVFYDASAWTVALAYGVPHSELRSNVSFTNQLKTVSDQILIPPSDETYAWLIDSRNDNLYWAIYTLLSNEVNVKAVVKPFQVTINGLVREFAAGSLMISFSDQTIPIEDVIPVVKQVGERITVESVQTGMSVSGPDLGSRSFRTMEMPQVLMVVGEGISSTEAGEKWFILDSNVGMPMTKVDILDFGRVDLSDYNTLILVSGSYQHLKESNIASIKEWTTKGGTLIAQRTAVTWVINKNLAQGEFVAKKDSVEKDRRNYSSSGEYRGALRIGGSIYEADIDITHPLGFGYTSSTISVYRNHSIFLQPSKNVYNTVVQYSSNPLLSGYIHPQNLKLVRNSASVVVSGAGRGRVVLLVDNPNFRGFWKGTDRIFLNSVFYGSFIF